MKAEPRFDYDLGLGHEGEQYCQEVWHTSKHETKRKSYLDDSFYVELEQNARHRGSWTPSGLAITEAAFFEFVIGTTGIVVCFPTLLLRQAVMRGIGGPRAVAGDNPTRGRLLGLKDLAQLETAQPEIEPRCATWPECDNNPSVHCKSCWTHLEGPYVGCPEHGYSA